MCVTPRDSSNGRYIERMLSHCCGNVASMSCSGDVVSTPRDSSNSTTLRGCCPFGIVVAMLCQCCVVRMLYQCFVIVATSLFDFRHRRNSEALALTRSPKECFISMGFEEQSFFSLLELACEQALLFGQAKRASRERFAARSRVLARLVSLAQIGELARRLCSNKC